MLDMVFESVQVFVPFITFFYQCTNKRFRLDFVRGYMSMLFMVFQSICVLVCFITVFYFTAIRFITIFYYGKKLVFETNGGSFFLPSSVVLLLLLPLDGSVGAGLGGAEMGSVSCGSGLNGAISVGKPGSKFGSMISCIVSKQGVGSKLKSGLGVMIPSIIFIVEVTGIGLRNGSGFTGTSSPAFLSWYASWCSHSVCKSLNCSPQQLKSVQNSFSNFCWLYLEYKMNEKQRKKSQKKLHTDRHLLTVPHKIHQNTLLFHENIWKREK